MDGKEEMVRCKPRAGPLVEQATAADVARFTSDVSEAGMVV